MTHLNRRTFLAGTAALSMAVISNRGFGQTSPGPFKLPPLPYPANALEPSIDARTMEIHHDRHHAGYVNNLNKAVSGHGQLAEMPLDQMLEKLKELPDSVRTAVRNNGGGHANHSMFWQIMGKDGGEPESDLAEAIKRDFGGLEKLKEQFNKTGSGVFGSGWVFVTVTPEGKLDLTSRPNQDTPLMDGGRVLMGNDVWEHAYYLKYQNRRADYLKAWWDVVNWKAVGERYTAARAGKLEI